MIKCAAVRPDLFAVAMLGQTICGIAQAFTLSVPARLSALWFESSKISTGKWYKNFLKYINII